jgi:hypothetical protein
MNGEFYQLEDINTNPGLTPWTSFHFKAISQIEQSIIFGKKPLEAAAIDYTNLLVNWFYSMMDDDV